MDASRRRRLTYGILTLLMFAGLFLAAFLTSELAREGRREQEAIAVIRRMGGHVGIQRFLLCRDAFWLGPPRSVHLPTYFPSPGESQNTELIAAMKNLRHLTLISVSGSCLKSLTNNARVDVQAIETNFPNILLVEWMD